MIQGSDAAGTVEAVGSGVSDFQKGDRVAGFTKMDGGDRTGTYAEYTIAKANTTFKLADNVTYEDAATVPLAYGTAAIGLRNLELTGSDSFEGELNKHPRSKDGKQTAILVYGASSTVGIFVTQLAKKLDLFVVGVAGASADLAKSYGADVILNYRSDKHDDELTAAVKEHDIKKAFDTVAEKGTPQKIAAALDANGGGQLTTLLPISDEDAEKLPKSVSKPKNGAFWTMVGDAHDPKLDGAQEYADKVSPPRLSSQQWVLLLTSLFPPAAVQARWQVARVRRAPWPEGDCRPRRIGRSRRGTEALRGGQGGGREAGLPHQGDSWTELSA